MRILSFLIAALVLGSVAISDADAGCKAKGTLREKIAEWREGREGKGLIAKLKARLSPEKAPAPVPEVKPVTKPVPAPEKAPAPKKNK